MKRKVFKLVECLILLISLIACGCSNGGSGGVKTKNNRNLGDYVIYAKEGNTYLYDGEKNEKYLLANDFELNCSDYCYVDEKNQKLVFNTSGIRDLNDLKKNTIMLDAYRHEETNSPFDEDHIIMHNNLIIYCRQDNYWSAGNIVIYNVKDNSKVNVLNNDMYNINVRLMNADELIYSCQNKRSTYEGNTINVTIGKYNLKTKDKIEKTKNVIEPCEIVLGKKNILVNECAIGRRPYEEASKYVGKTAKIYSFNFQDGFALLDELVCDEYTTVGNKKDIRAFNTERFAQKIQGLIPFDFLPPHFMDRTIGKHEVTRCMISQGAYYTVPSNSKGYDYASHVDNLYNLYFNGEFVGDGISNYLSFVDGMWNPESTRAFIICENYIPNNYDEYFFIENKKYDGKLIAINESGSKAIVRKGDTMYEMDLASAKLNNLAIDTYSIDVYKYDDANFIYETGGSIVKNGQTIYSGSAEKVIFNDDFSIGIFLTKDGTLDVYKDNVVSTVAGEVSDVILSNKDNIFYQTKSGELYYYKNGEANKVDDANMRSMPQYKIIR